MLKIQLSVMLGIFGLANFNILADPTILGFEDTLEHSEKARLKKFIHNHKQVGHQKCYYYAPENTVVCEDSDGIIYPFR